MDRVRKNKQCGLTPLHAGRITSIPGRTGAIGEEAILSQGCTRPVLKSSLLYQHKNSEKKHQAQKEKGKILSLYVYASQK
jgi:hypothetical protein